jgi:prolipoprotein diacylglyceryltransferase
MNTDERMKAILREADEAAGYDPDRQDSLRDVLMTGFRGRLKWAGIVSWVYIALFAVVAAVAAARYFGVSAVRDQIMYATLFALSMAIVLTAKLWYWQLVHRHTLQRELKRLEYAVTRLVEEGSQRHGGT